jgi:hypothetical protein
MVDAHEIARHPGRDTEPKHCADREAGEVAEQHPADIREERDQFRALGELGLAADGGRPPPPHRLTHEQHRHGEQHSAEADEDERQLPRSQVAKAGEDDGRQLGDQLDREPAHHQGQARAHELGAGVEADRAGQTLAREVVTDR